MWQIAGYENDISMYTINATTGALASIGTIAAGTGPVSVAVDPAGKFAYAVNFRELERRLDVHHQRHHGGLNAHRNDSYRSISYFGSGTSVRKICRCDELRSNNVSMYSIDGATGALTLIGTIGT